ncbi:cytochrome P450 CYP82D47-like [Solanum dulcamara]|uniref:cytochrome P450 CYP82D47-like n=1 Tax=Solanum dulcamara TaxID=45834 RepID=UPI0024859F5C|nr:cytochrome P450 CYP82D47-like [Solanum dulcamara]
MDSVLIAVTLASSLFVLFLLHKHFFSTKKQSRIRRVPEAGGAWPIIGHLHLLGGSESDQLPHKILGRMADKYGPIFGMKLGVHQAIVVSDPKLAKECFTTNDLALASRPKSMASEIIGYKDAMIGLGPYGPYWRETRKIATIELFSTRRIETLKHVREFEVKSAIKEVYNNWVKNNLNGAVKMEMKEWIEDLVMNTMGKMLFGKRRRSNEEEGINKAHKAIRRFFELLGAFVVADFLPYLRWLDIGGHEKAMKEVAKELDFVVEEWLAEHKLKKIKSVEEEDFMDVMLSICEDRDLPGFDADTAIKATCMALLSAGTDTTIVTLTWTLSLLLNNYEALQKAQDELDAHVGKNRWVKESDIKNMVYLQAIIKEALRLYPAAPLSVPHESMEDCTINGYDIPKGTRLLVNLWKIHHDPNIWPNPHEFKPERFLTTHKDVDVRGNHFELLPFGSGRRMCPGISLALQVLPFVIAVLLQGFDMKRTSDEPIDMSESFGLTVLKASPLEVLLAPRLAAVLYE